MAKRVKKIKPAKPNPFDQVIEANKKLMEDNKEVIKKEFVAGTNGEVITLVRARTGPCSTDFSYVPELDDPIKAKPKKWIDDDEMHLQEELLKAPVNVKSEYELPKKEPEKPPEKPVQKQMPMATQVLIEELVTERNISKLSNVAGIVQACFIIGGGPSFEHYINLLAIHKKLTFGCSGTPLLFPHLRHWYSCDKLSTQPMKDWLWQRSSDCVKCMCYEAWKNEQVPDDCYVTKTPAQGPVNLKDMAEHGLWHGCSSVIGAMEMARLMGYKTFFIFGLDYTTDGKHPFDKVDPGQQKKPTWDRDRVQRHWMQVKEAYHNEKCMIFNCNPDSLLVKLNIQPYLEPSKAFASVRQQG